jgi:hypothetical protein
MTLFDILPNLTPNYRRSLPFGLLSRQLWQQQQGTLASVGRRPPMQTPALGLDATPELQNPADGGDIETSTEESSLPDAVVRSFQEALDGEGLRFLRHGPRTDSERLAFAQSVGPGAHSVAVRAPERMQKQFQERHVFDRGRYFVGPDLALYVRDGDTTEPLAYRVRRQIENAVGGYTQPDVEQLLASASFEGAGQAEHGVQVAQSTESETGPPDLADVMRGTTARELHRKENRWPTLGREADRRKSIIGDTPGVFALADSPNASPTTPWYSVHDNGYYGVARNDSMIAQEARRIGVDPDLMRAIMYVEYANGYSYGGPAQLLGQAKSLYPMNIRPDRWQALVGDDGDFNDSATNIRAGALLLKRIGDRLSDPSIAKIATLYNSLAKDQVTNYGAQVARAYEEKPWTKKPDRISVGRGPDPRRRAR